MGKLEPKKVFNTLFFNLVDEFKDIFDYNDPKSHFNMAIYIRLPNCDTLKCAYTLRDDYFEKLKGNNESRPWEIGLGHVGQCYARNTSDLIKDLTDHPDFQRVEKTGDSNHYRAAMSVPLRRSWVVEPEAEDKEIQIGQEKFGVLVMTSSVPGQFKRHRLEMLKYLRKKLEEFIYEVTSEESENEACEV